MPVLFDTPGNSTHKGSIYKLYFSMQGSPWPEFTFSQFGIFESNFHKILEFVQNMTKFCIHFVANCKFL